MEAVAALLAGLGHNTIASVQGPVETSTGRERAESIRAALSRFDITLRRDHTARTTFSHDGGREAGMRLLDRSDPPTAIVCGNDVIAMGVLSAARELHMRVPEDLTVTGFDNIPMAGWPIVGLTTVHCDLRRLAGAAVSMLTAEMADPSETPADLRIPVSLISRQTHSQPRK